MQAYIIVYRKIEVVGEALKFGFQPIVKLTPSVCCLRYSSTFWLIPATNATIGELHF